MALSQAEFRKNRSALPLNLGDGDFKSPFLEVLAKCLSTRTTRTSELPTARLSLRHSGQAAKSEGHQPITTATSSDAASGNGSPPPRVPQRSAIPPQDP